MHSLVAGADTGGGRPSLMGGVSLAKLVRKKADGFHVKVDRFNVDKP